MTITDYYVATDAMGSVTAILDDEGNVLERRSYDAFGEMTYMVPNGTPVAESPTGVDVGFQGQVRDEVTGLYQMGYRWYNCSTGRWLNPDPVKLKGGHNQFMFTSNNPVRIMDPYGLWGSDAHNEILVKFFKDMLGSIDVKCACCKGIDIFKLIIHSSKDVDELKGQGTKDAYKHAMRSPDESIDEAREMYNRYINSDTLFVKSFLNKYKKTRCPCGGDGYCEQLEEALKAVGQIFHAVSDRYSPVHGNFDEWPGEIGATKGGIISGVAAAALGITGWGLVLSVLAGGYVGSGAIGHGDPGKEGPSNYHNMDAMQRRAMEEDLRRHLGRILLDLRYLC